MSDRLDALIVAHLDGTLDEAGRVELNEILKRDASARPRFAAAMRQETLLGEILRDTRSAAEARPVPRRAPRRFRRVEGPQSFAPWALAAAAGILVMLAVLFASRSTPPSEPVARQEKPAPPEPTPKPAPAPRTPPRVVPAPKRETTPPEAPPTPVPDVVPPAPKRPEAPLVPSAPPPPAPKTTVAVATVQTVEGEASVRAGDGIVAGQGIDVADGRVVAALPDGSRVELGNATKVRSFGADRIEIAQGVLLATVKKQPRPLVVATPHGEARVLGTVFRVVVGESTRLEVREGKVRLTSNGKSVDVAAGSWATTATLKTRSLPQIADPSLVGHWRLDEGRGTAILDSSFGANDGAANGATWGPGRSGAALRFDGVDDTAALLGRFPFPKNALTVAAWVRHESLPNKVQRYVVVRSDSQDLAVIRHDGADGPKQLDFFVQAGNALCHARANDVLTVGAWLHVAGTWDGKAQKLFLNGAEVARAETAGALAAREGTEVWIGVPREPMHGSVDDVRVYNRALSEKEIADLARGK